jgi:hypothetical protein
LYADSVATGQLTGTPLLCPVRFRSSTARIVAVHLTDEHRNRASAATFFDVFGSLTGLELSLDAVISPADAEKIAAVVADDPDIITLGGDQGQTLSGYADSQANSDAASRIIANREAALRRFPHGWVPGNHEGLSNVGAPRTIRIASEEKYRCSAAGAQSYAVVNYGNVSYFFANHYTTEGSSNVLEASIAAALINWLQTSTATHLVTIDHKLFSSAIIVNGRHGIGFDMSGEIATFWPYLSARKAIVIYGHNHHFGFGVRDGVKVVSVGGMANHVFIDPTESKHFENEWGLFSLRADGYARLTFEGAKFTLEFVKTATYDVDTTEFVHGLKEVVYSYTFEPTISHTLARAGPRTAQDVLGLDIVRGSWIDPPAETRLFDREPAVVESEPSGGEHRVNTFSRLLSR